MAGLGTKGLFLLPRRLGQGQSGMGGLGPKAPVITSDGGGGSATIDVDEGDTAVTTVVAKGGGQIQYFISGGADRGLFEINQTTGILVLKAPGVIGAYEVFVEARNAGGSDFQTLTVNVQAPYQALAVLGDGNTWSEIASLIAGADSGLWLSSKWINYTSFNADNFLVSDPENNYFNSEGADSNGKYAPSFSSDTGSLSASNGDVLSTGVWLNILVFGNTNASAGNKTLQIYVNDAVYNFTKADASDAFLMSLDAVSFVVGGDTYGGFVGKCADVQFWFGAALNGFDLSVEANRRLFIDDDGNPVDPAVAAAQLGTPLILCQRTTNPASFAANQGSGGALVTTGAWGDGGVVTPP